MNLATREAYGNTLAELKDNENVVVLEADLGHATKSLKFKEVCPQRFFNMGIAEADMIGTAGSLREGSVRKHIQCFCDRKSV